MYDLDNGTENIKVKEIVANKITAGSGVVTIKGGLSVDGATVFTGDVFLDYQLRLGAYPTASRPTAGESAIIYDTDLKKCILWNGTAWVNLDGTALS